MFVTCHCMIESRFQDMLAELEHKKEMLLAEIGTLTSEQVASLLLIKESFEVLERSIIDKQKLIEDQLTEMRNLINK